MFFQPVPGSNAGISRPFIVGLVMLLLFLSMQVRVPHSSGDPVISCAHTLAMIEVRNM
jgi:hypothetical protein